MASALDLLTQTSARLFAEASDPELQDAVANGEWPAALWQAVEDNGLPLALVPEAQGGVGLSWLEATAVLRLAGSFAVPLPLAETMIGKALLAETGLDPGSGPLALAPCGFGDSFGLEADHGDGNGFRVSGHARRAPWAGSVDRIALVASAAPAGPAGSYPLGSVRIVIVTGLASLERPAVVNHAGDPMAELVLDRFAIASDQVSAPLEVGHPLAQPDAVLLRYALARSAQMAGAMDRVLDLTLEHARGREQFGRPIARFQAVQQQISALAAEVAVVGAAVEAAARALDDSALATAKGEAEIAIAAAKARAGDAATQVAAIAHQVHGAIGFTREHVLHRFTRRLVGWRDEAGNERDWQQRVGARVAAAGADSLWQLLTGA